MRVRKIAKRDYQLCHVCSSVHIEQLLSHWTNFHQIWYLSTFIKYLEKIEVSLKTDKNNGYSDEDMCICLNISEFFLE